MERFEIINELLQLVIRHVQLTCSTCAIRQTKWDERGVAIRLCLEHDVDWHLIPAVRGDPGAFYESLLKNKHRHVLIIDHAERIFADTALVSVMRQAAEFQVERTIHHPDMGSSFSTKCRYILLSEAGVEHELPGTVDNLRPFVHGLFDRGCAPFI